MSDIEKRIDDKLGVITTEFTETRDKISALEKAGKAHGDRLEKLDKVIEDLVPTIVEKQAIEGIHKQLDQIEAKMERQLISAEENGIDHSEHKEITKRFLLVGDDDREVRKFVQSETYEKLRTAREYRTLQITDDTKGGYLLDPETEAMIEKNALSYSPIRQVARVSQTTKSEVNLKYRTAGPTMTIHGESGSPSTKTESAYAKIKIPIYHGMIETQATRDSLDDIESFEQQIMEDASEAIADGEGYYFVLGSGAAAQPEGLANAGYSTVTGADTSNHNIHGDDFWNLYAALNAKWRQRATFILNTATLVAAMKLKDTNSDYIFFRDLTQGITTSLIGFPFLIAEDVADDGTQNNKALYFGDFSRAYRIIDRMGMVVLRDPYSSKPDVEFQFDKRFGAGGYVKEAAKVLIMG